MPPLLATRSSSKISRGSAKVKPCGRPNRAREILDDAPIFARFAGRVHRLVDLDDAAFDLRDSALVFFLETAGQDDVGVARGVVQEEVDGDKMLELVERACDEAAVRQRDLRVEADRDERLDLALVDLAKELVRVDAGSRD